MNIMDVPIQSIEAETFFKQGLQPTSPPLTPDSPPALHAQRRRLFGRLQSPPPNIRPRGNGHQFSYTPPRNDRYDDGASSSDDDNFWTAFKRRTSFSKHRHPRISQGSSQLKSGQSHISKQIDIPSEPESDVANPDPADPLAPAQETLHIVITETSYDFDLEEVFGPDFENLDVLRPYLIEDATSEKGADDVRDDAASLAENLRQFKFSLASQSMDFDHRQRIRYMQRQKRWSRGGSHKRSHTESVGSTSADDDDLKPPPNAISIQQGGIVSGLSCGGGPTRRLRRRTQGPEDMIRPRTSLLFDEIPAELDELKYLEENIPPDLAEDVAELDEVLEPFWMDQIWVDEWSELSADEEEALTDDEERRLPRWLYAMEVESNPSRPTTAGGRHRA